MQRYIIIMKLAFSANYGRSALISTLQGSELNACIASFINFSFFSMSVSLREFYSRLSPMKIWFSPGEKRVLHKCYAFYARSLIKSIVLLRSPLLLTWIALSRIFLTNGFEFELTRFLNDVVDKFFNIGYSRSRNIMLNYSWLGAIWSRKSITSRHRFKNACSSMHDYFSATSI